VLACVGLVLRRGDWGLFGRDTNASGRLCLTCDFHRSSVIDDDVDLTAIAGDACCVSVGLIFLYCSIFGNLRYNGRDSLVSTTLPSHGPARRRVGCHDQALPEHGNLLPPLPFFRACGRQICPTRPISTIWGHRTQRLRHGPALTHCRRPRRAVISFFFVSSSQLPFFFYFFSSSCGSSPALCQEPARAAQTTTEALRQRPAIARCST